MLVGAGDEHFLSVPDSFGQLPFQILSRRRPREHAFDHLTADVFEGRELTLQVAVADWLAIVPVHGCERPVPDLLTLLDCLGVVLQTEPQRLICGHLGDRLQRFHPEFTAPAILRFWPFAAPFSLSETVYYRDERR